MSEKDSLAQAGIFLGVALQNVDESKLQELNQGLSNVSQERLAEIRKAIDKPAVKMEIPVGHTDRHQITEEQKKCPFCHDFDGHGPDLFKCNTKDADASIDLKENAIYFDNSDGSRTSGMFKIKFCPMCARKLER